MRMIPWLDFYLHDGNIALHRIDKQITILVRFMQFETALSFQLLHLFSSGDRCP